MDTLRQLGVLALAASAAPLFATAPITPQHVRPRLIAATTTLVPGETAELAVTFDIDPKWHIYWNGRNDTGFAPDIKLTLPEGYVALPARWPAPTRHVMPGDILDHVYEKTATIILPVKVPADASTPAKFSAEINWLVCNDVCVPESGTVELTIPMMPKGPAAASPDAKLITVAKSRVPKPLADAAGRVAAKFDGAKLVIECPTATALAFYPYEDCAETPRLLTQGEAAKPRLDIDTTPGPSRVTGVVHVTRKPGEPPEFYTIDLPPAK